MSRSGYSDDCENPALWRGQVASAIRGRRGQTLLKEMLDALDAMPNKRLVASALENDGEVCALGALGQKRGIDMSRLDPEDCDAVADTFGVAHQLVREIVFMNDEYSWQRISPEDRWTLMHNWVAEQIK